MAENENNNGKRDDLEPEEGSEPEAEVVGRSGQEWFYSEKVKEHFFNPQNILTTAEEAQNYKADGIGIVGSPACGDVMKLCIKVDKD